tara:strand:- start:1337 stop:2257 length:921 start_codon:yes stop_codon:yes gene_type:complete
VKKKLSIVIPSFNRIDFLKLNLEEIIEEATESDIQVILSQDGRNEKIMKFSKQLANKYDNFYFIEHTDRLGHDDNFLKCFDLHDSDYTWILGDSISIHEGSIREILDVIDKHSPDIIGLNADHRKIDHDQKRYEDPSLIFSKFAWHLTYTGSVVYSRDAFKITKTSDFSRAPDFPHTAIIFYSLAQDCNFFWINRNLIYSKQKKVSYWYKDAIETFIYNWEKAVHSLPDIYEELKEDVILQHSDNSGVFSFKSLLKMRFMGYFNLKIYLSNKNKLSSHSRLSSVTLLSIAIFPRFLIRVFLFLFRK